ncbi:TlpA family protein disulfide reductase [Ekhidna sp.]
MNHYSILFISLIVASSCSKAQGVDEKIRQKILEVDNGYQLSEKSWLITEEEDTLSFQSIKGQWIILDYWTAGCKPCIEAFPVLKSISEHDSMQLKIVAINVDKSFSKFKKYSKKYNIGYSNYFGGFTLSNPLFLPSLKLIENEDGKSSVITLTPQYVLIDPSGKIVNRNLSKPGSKAFHEEIKIINR